MACHTPPFKIANKQGEMPLPSLGHIPSLNPIHFYRSTVGPLIEELDRELNCFVLDGGLKFGKGFEVPNNCTIFILGINTCSYSAYSELKASKGNYRIALIWICFTLVLCTILKEVIDP